MEKEQVYMCITLKSEDGVFKQATEAFYTADKHRAAMWVSGDRNRVFLFPQMTQITKADIILS